MGSFPARAFVWTGGALFLASLLTTAWTYAVAFSRDLPGPNGRAGALDLLLLSAFALHHSLFARTRAKEIVARLLPEPLIRSSYVWVASVLLIGVCTAWRPIGGTAYQFEGWRASPFYLAQLAGLLLIVRATRAIRALELAGIEAPRPHDELQVAGVYGQVRHPLYLGWMLMVWSTAHLTGDRALFAVATTAYIMIAIPWEERSLAREFGAAYDRYRARVRWRVVPYVY